MPNEGIIVSMLAGLFVAIFVYGTWTFGRQRQEVDGRFDELGIKSMAARLGLALDPSTIGKSIEGKRLLSAMIRCNRCRSVKDCRAFVADEEADAFAIVGFCPNSFFLSNPHDGRPPNLALVEVA